MRYWRLLHSRPRGDWDRSNPLQTASSKGPASVGVALLVVEMAARIHELDFDQPALPGVLLVIRSVEHDVFRSQVAGHLGECFEKLFFLRWQEQLAAGFLAQPAQFLVVGGLDHSAGDAGEVL